MENQKNNKMELLAKRMQAFLDNFSKDNRKNNIDRRNYKKTGFKYVSEKVFYALLKRRGYGDMSFKGTPDMGDRVTAIYENSLKQEKLQQDEVR